MYISAWRIDSSREGQDLTDEFSAALHILMRVHLRNQWTIAACVCYVVLCYVVLFCVVRARASYGCVRARVTLRVCLCARARACVSVRLVRLVEPLIACCSVNHIVGCRYIPDRCSSSAPLKAAERAFMNADMKRLRDEQMAIVCAGVAVERIACDEVFPSPEYLAISARNCTRDARLFFLSGFKQVEELASRESSCYFLYATPTMVTELRQSHAKAPKFPLLSQANEWLVRAQLRLAVGMSLLSIHSSFDVGFKDLGF